MPKWLDTKGDSVLSIFVCDRCHMKRKYSDMRPDGNIPAIKVCSESCSDSFDPYRLPARQPEKISIRFPRPDADVAQYNDAITTDPNVVNTPNNVTQGTAGEYGIAPETSEDDLNGNLDNLSP
jgi:hypothetical protein